MLFAGFAVADSKPPSANAIARVTAANTNSLNLVWTVTFNEPVTTTATAAVGTDVTIGCTGVQGGSPCGGTLNVAIGTSGTLGASHTYTLSGQTCTDQQGCIYTLT